MSRPLNDIQQAPTLTIVTLFHPESDALTRQSLSGGLMTLAASCRDCRRVPQWSVACPQASSGGAGNLGHFRSGSHTAPSRTFPWHHILSSRLEAPRFVKGSLANQRVRLDNDRGDMSHLRALCNARAASTSAIRCAAAGMCPGVFVVRLAFAGSAGPLIGSLNVAAAGESHGQLSALY
jgi:hypothetical protein